VCCALLVGQRWRTTVRCVFGARNSLNAAAERGGSRGAPASRGHCLPFQTTVGRRFASGRPGRRGRRPGGSRGAAAWSLGLWGTHPSMAENGPSRRCGTPFRCPGGRVWGSRGPCVCAGGGARACGAREGSKELALSKHTSRYSSELLVLLAKRSPPCPTPQPAHVSRVSEKSPRSPGHRLAAARLAGRAKRARRRFWGARSWRGGGRA
jgi:hypothetical protein